MQRLCSWTLAITALCAQPPATRELFPERPVCRVPSKESPVANEMFEVFTDAKTGKELFRIHIGRRDGKQWLKWWRYGVWNCGDFNRDGVLDYTWYGGDDTSQGHYLILSSPSGHRIIDIEATFEKEWVRRYGGKAPDLSSLEQSFLHRVTLRWVPGTMTLIAEGQRMSGPFGVITRMESTADHWVALP